MTFDESIQIDNYKAQYNSIVGNITVANRELEEVLEKKEAAKETLQTISRQIEAKIAELDELLKAEEESKARQAARESGLNRREEELNRRSVEIEAEHQYNQTHLAAEREVLRRKKELMQGEISTLEARKQDLEIRLAVVREDADRQLKHCESLSQEHATLLSKIDIAKAELADLESKSDKTAKKLAKEIKALEKDKATLVKSLEEPRRILDAREKDLARREKDVEIYKKRFQQWHQKMFPGGNIQL